MMVSPLAHPLDRGSRRSIRRLLSWTLTASLAIGTAVHLTSDASTTSDASDFEALPLDPALAHAITVVEQAVVPLAVEKSSEMVTAMPGNWPSVGHFDDVRIEGTPVTAPADTELPTVPEFGAVPEYIASEPADDPFIVMIDPGHGGTDPGSTAPNGLLEKDLTRDIAERTRLFLGEIDNMVVLMTREGDTGLSRQHRVDRIRNSGADLVVSLHFNHLPQPNVNLVESFYADRENIMESRELQRKSGAHVHSGDEQINLDFTDGSRRIAGLVQNRVFNEVKKGSPNAIDAGAKRDTLFVLTRSLTPGALVELSCISNPEEAERLTNEDYRNELSAAIADAVRDYRSSLKTRPLGALDV